MTSANKTECQPLNLARTFNPALNLRQLLLKNLRQHFFQHHDCWSYVNSKVNIIPYSGVRPESLSKLHLHEILMKRCFSSNEVYTYYSACVLPKIRRAESTSLNAVVRNTKCSKSTSWIADVRNCSSLQDASTHYWPHCLDDS